MIGKNKVARANRTEAIVEVEIVDFVKFDNFRRVFAEVYS